MGDNVTLLCPASSDISENAATPKMVKGRKWEAHHGRRAPAAPRRSGKPFGRWPGSSTSGEEWYRQLLSWRYQAQGYIVLYDRHFLFDFSLDGVDSNVMAFERRLHRWILTRFYPRPSLVVYLDAPAEVLFGRKGEKTHGA
jgi:hypothetical protein